MWHTEKGFKYNNFGKKVSIVSRIMNLLSILVVQVLGNTKVMSSKKLIFSPFITRFVQLLHTLNRPYWDDTIHNLLR